ncbi:MAG TPA: anhydro-N-acetylmuramic acid kinase [bacterium]|nr:anhydro-N-acetylmuramic acid kinase [bacterium]
MTADPFARIRAKPTKTIIGLISGTSADGITAAAVEITDRPGDRPGIRLRGWATTPYPDGVRQRLVDMFTEPATMQEAASLNYLLGELFASAALAAARAAGYGMDSVDLIASHGQTVAHVAAGDPANPLSRAATLQLAEAAVIAERTGRPVIADFRAADMAAGGVGAPFVPYADLLLLGGPTGRIALNLGGISNLTVLPAGTRREDVYAFDCGPANMIIDGLARHFFGEPFDRDGAHAARGRVHREMLASLMNHPFIAAAPPKAAGHEQFGRPFLHDLLARWGAVPPEDLLATATAFAAHAVALNLSRHVLPRHPVEELIASGGGVHNPTLLRDLTAAVAPLRVRRIDEFGVPSDAKEALAFALLGHASLMGLPGNLPRVTGARHAAVLGKFTWPPGAAEDSPA